MRPVVAYILWTTLAFAAMAIVHAHRRQPATWQQLALGLVATASVSAFAWVSWGRATPFGDFNKAYLFAGATVADDPSRLYACDVSNLCFVNLPLVAFLFAPLAWMGTPAAQVLFSIVGASAVAAAVWLVVREFELTGAARYAAVAVFALNGPLLYSARLGNLTHALLPLVITAFSLLVRRREIAAGVLIAMLTVIKLPFALFVVYLIVRRRMQAAAASIAALVAVVGVSIGLFGIDLHRQWLAQFVGPFAAQPVGAYNVQSIAGMLARLLVPGHLTDWAPLPVTAGFTLLRHTLGAGLIVLAAAAMSARSQRPWREDIELSVVLLLMLLVGPLTWTHYYGFLTIPLSVLLGRTVAADVPAAWKAAVLLAAALVSMPVVLPQLGHPLAAAFVERVLISHYAFGGILMLCELCVASVLGANAAQRACRMPPAFTGHAP
jgi:alpha-1,2-mannosyltransferase